MIAMPLTGRLNKKYPKVDQSLLLFKCQVTNDTIYELKPKLYLLCLSLILMISSNYSQGSRSNTIRLHNNIILNQSTAIRQCRQLLLCT